MSGIFLLVLALIMPAATEPKSVREGRKLFTEHCVACHAMDGSGSGRGADLRGKLRYGSKRKDVENVIRRGIPGLMPGIGLDRASVRQLAAFVLHLNRKERSR